MICAEIKISGDNLLNLIVNNPDFIIISADTYSSANHNNPGHLRATSSSLS